MKFSRPQVPEGMQKVGTATGLATKLAIALAALGVTGAFLCGGVDALQQWIDSHQANGITGLPAGAPAHVDPCNPGLKLHTAAQGDTLWNQCTLNGYTTGTGGCVNRVYPLTIWNTGTNQWESFDPTIHTFNIGEITVGQELCIPEL